ncbi:hypothetical protein HDV01_001633 [Terramyces sp. JEL0728]|nr:hypothetical protein HDV01_001633 [Terramyces sp. JEL0728]
MGVNVVLVITAVVFAILVVIASLYFVVYFQHPQDKWVAWFPKAVVVASLSCAAWNLFLLPLDVANQNGLIGAANGLPMDKLTLGFFGCTIGLVVLIVPFTVFYYEGEDSDDNENGESSAGAQFGYAIKYIIPTLIILAGIIAAMYWGGLGYAEIKTTYLQSPLFDTTLIEQSSLDFFFSFEFYCNGSAIGVPITLRPKIPLSNGSTYTPIPVGYANNNWKPGFGCQSLTSNTYGIACCKVPAVNDVVVSPGVFVVAVMTLVGWAIFSVFCGVGMAALPYDWLNEFKHRPKPITATEYQDRKKMIGEQSAILMEAYKTLSQELKMAGRSNNFSRKYRQIKNRENRFRKDVVILEYHYRNLEDAYRFQGGNLILQWAKFLFAILSSILTLMWLIHIALYVIPVTLQMKGVAINPISPFLNDMLNATAGIPIIGIFLYGLFTFYLLGCVIKGNAKLGMRIIFFTIHPLA